VEKAEDLHVTLFCLKYLFGTVTIMQIPPLSVLVTFPPANYVNPELRGSELIVLVAIAIPLLLIVVGLRIYSRARISRNFGADDVCVILAMVRIILSHNVEPLGEMLTFFFLDPNHGFHSHRPGSQLWIRLEQTCVGRTIHPDIARMEIGNGSRGSIRPCGWTYENINVIFDVETHITSRRGFAVVHKITAGFHHSTNLALHLYHHLPMHVSHPNSELVCQI
jgi:hypothetical protein